MTTNNDMITRCPQCNTAFRVTQELLGIANGTVRCGSCLSVFKAEEYIANQSTPDKTNTQETNQVVTPELTGTNKTKSGIGKRLRKLIHNDEDDILIHDDLHKHDDEDNSQSSVNQSSNVFDLQNTGLDLKSNNNSNSHFEAAETELKHSTKEKTDESWAMDLLAEIEDDDVQPINIKRQKKDDATSESAIAEAAPAQKTQPQKNTPSKPRDNTKEAPLTQAELTQDTESHIDSLEPTHPQEEPYESITATKHDDPLLATEMENTAPISDEQIENAMHHKTAYAGSNASIMGGFESDPLEMEWSETSHKRRWLWFVGIIAMALLLALQVAWLRFDTLSKQPNYRPYYAHICKIVGCELTKLVDINKIRANNLVVRSHPEKSNALIVDVILVNTADFEQSYPALRLEFSGINNEPIANRNFQPSEYLKGELAGSQIMKNNQPIQLSLELVDPGETAVNYRITAITAKNAN